MCVCVYVYMYIYVCMYVSIYSLTVLYEYDWNIRCIVTKGYYLILFSVITAHIHTRVRERESRQSEADVSKTIFLVCNK